MRLRLRHATTILLLITYSKHGNGYNSQKQVKKAQAALLFSTTEGNIDISGKSNSFCINHSHHQNKNSRPHFHKRYSMTVTTDENTKCFAVYNELDCKGAHLKFYNVTFKELRFDRELVDTQEIETLLNFYVTPKSFSRCNFGSTSTEGWSDHDELCSNNLTLWVSDHDGKEITEKCTDVPYFTNINRNYNIRERLGTIYLKGMLPTQDLKPPICIELYPNKQCKGEMVKYIVTEASLEGKSSSPNASPVMLWKNYMVNGQYTYRSIDTDVKSVKKCKCLNSRENGDSTSTTTISFSKPRFQVPKFSNSEDSSDVSNRIALPSVGEEADKSKQCDDCKTIESFIKTGEEKSDSCYSIFNQSSCIVTTKVISIQQLLNLTAQHHEFLNWTIVGHCEVEKCLKPTTKSFEKFQEVISLFFMIKENKSTGNKKQLDTLSKGDKVLLAIAGVLVSIMLSIVIVLGLLLWRKKRRIRAIRNHRIVPKHRPAGVGPGSGSSVGGAHFHQIDPIGENDYVNDVTGLQALCRSFESGGYQIPRENIDIGNIRDNAQIIGIGEFSIAFKGKLEPGGRTVAVKTMKSGHGSARSMKRVLLECRVFKECGKHERIVEFIGVCTQNVRAGEIFVVMAFCDNGPLKSFLVQYRSHFLNLVKEGEMKQDEDLKSYSERSIEGGPPPKFNTFQLFKWCWEMADAMEYLALRKIVHVSLCSRNVMLDSEYKAKLCDFRLARMPSEGTSSSFNNWINTNKERSIPWRFYAVESLIDDIFTTKSDAWSFGVFMWEVFTLGATPYPEQMYGGEFLQILKHGYRLLKPEMATIDRFSDIFLRCPVWFYQLMLICWYDDPDKRPTFTKLKSKLESMIL